MSKYTPKEFWARATALVCVIAAAHTVGGSPGYTQDVPFSRGLQIDSAEDIKDVPRTPTFRAFLPARIDLSYLLPIPGDQKSAGSCTAWAVGYAARAYYANTVEQRNPNSRANIPSPSYIYRAILESPGKCTGTRIPDALDLLKDRGVLSLSQLPYDERNCSPLSFEQMARASDFRIDGWNVVRRDTADQFLDNVKGELAQSNPVIIAMRASDSFDRLRPGEIFHSPSACKAGEQSCGHAVVAVGYDEQKQAFKLINSWGTKWGDGGFGWIAYEAFKTEVRHGYVMRVGRREQPTCSITANPATVDKGGSAALSFISHHADSGVIDGGVGNVLTSGTRTVSPLATTTYQGKFSGRGGTATCSVTVAVTQPAPPAVVPTIASFSANPVSVQKGEKVTLSWSVRGASSVRIDNGIGIVAGNSVTLTPTITTDYMLSAENSAGTVTAKARVTITESRPPPVKPVIASFVAKPISVNKGQPAILSWSVQGATSLRIDNGIGVVTGNTISVSPAVATDYTLTAENGAGRTTAKATVSVAPEVVASPVCALSVAPSPIVQGDTATLTYVAENADGGSIDNGVGRVSPSGTKSISPAKTTTYTGTFSGAGGSVSCAATIVVQEAVAPPVRNPVISSFEAGPASIAKGKNSTLLWSVSEATSVHIDNGIGVVTGNSVTVSPNETTTYTLTAENVAGSANANTTVTITSSSEITLPDVECGKVSLNRRGSKIFVEGFVGYDKDFEAIKASAPTAEIDVKVRPWPQCEALQTLDKALSLTDRPKVSIRRKSGDTLDAGDPLVFDIQTPSYLSYVHVAYIQADGSVINLIQPGDGSFKTYAPGSKIVIGDNSAARRFFVKEPYGREMLIVLVGRSPVFPDRRPRQETEREFLTGLRRALIAKPDINAPDRDIVASFDAIVTKDK